MPLCLNDCTKKARPRGRRTRRKSMNCSKRALSNQTPATAENHRKREIQFPGVLIPPPRASSHRLSNCLPNTTMAPVLSKYTKTRKQNTSQACPTLPSPTTSTRNSWARRKEPYLQSTTQESSSTANRSLNSLWRKSLSSCRLIRI